MMCAACGTTSPTAIPPATSPSPVVTTQTTAAASTTAATTTITITAGGLTDDDNARVISVHVGDTFPVVLHSTYWSPPVAADQLVLSVATPVIEPQLNGCVPGQGCGTVTVTVTAIAPGRSLLTAHRDTCGEAMACAPDQQNWQISITVT